MFEYGKRKKKWIGKEKKKTGLADFSLSKKSLLYKVLSTVDSISKTPRDK